MLKYTVCNYYKVHNPGASAAFGIPAGGSKIVALNPAHLIASGSSLLTAIQTGAVTVTNIKGDPVPSNRAGMAFLALQSEVNPFRNDLSDAETYVSAVYGKAIRLHWNLSAQHALLDLIGSDILTTDFSALTVTREQVVERLAPVYTLTGQGMFQEAAALLGTFTPDDFLTTARLAEYGQILLGADAFSVTL